MKTKKTKINTKETEKSKKMQEDMEYENDMYDFQLMIKCSMGYEDCNPEESCRAKSEVKNKI